MEVYREDYFLVPGAMSFVERSKIQCLFLGWSFIRGSTVVDPICA